MLRTTLVSRKILVAEARTPPSTLVSSKTSAVEALMFRTTPVSTRTSPIGMDHMLPMTSGMNTATPAVLPRRLLLLPTTLGRVITPLRPALQIQALG